MDYKTNVEFLDWLMWDKEVNEKGMVGSKRRSESGVV